MIIKANLSPSERLRFGWFEPTSVMGVGVSTARESVNCSMPHMLQNYPILRFLGDYFIPIFSKHCIVLGQL